MHCEEFEKRLQSILDERLLFETDPLLIQHTQVCDTCCGLMLAYEEFLKGLDSTTMLTPSSNVIQDVMDQLDSIALTTSSSTLPPLQNSQPDLLVPYTTEQPVAYNNQRFSPLAIALSLLLLVTGYFILQSFVLDPDTPANIVQPSQDTGDKEKKTAACLRLDFDRSSSTSSICFCSHRTFCSNSSETNAKCFTLW